MILPESLKLTSKASASGHLALYDHYLSLTYFLLPSFRNVMNDILRYTKFLLHYDVNLSEQNYPRDFRLFLDEVFFVHVAFSSTLFHCFVR